MTYKYKIQIMHYSSSIDSFPNAFLVEDSYTYIHTLWPDSLLKWHQKTSNFYWQDRYLGNSKYCYFFLNNTYEKIIFSISCLISISNAFLVICLKHIQYCWTKFLVIDLWLVKVYKTRVVNSDSVNIVFGVKNVWGQKSWKRHFNI